MAMHSNCGLPVPGGSSFPFVPPNSQNFNPNTSPSFPMFQQNTAPTFSPSHHQNSQHVFQSNSGFSHHMHSPFIPDLQVIKSVPPPSLMPSAPQPFPGIQIPENSTPAWNPAPMINNGHFIDQASQFQVRSPNSFNFPPLMHPSTNYNDMNATYPGSNGFGNQQNSRHDRSGLQTSEATQGNQITSLPSVNSNSYDQPRSNSINYTANPSRNDQYHRKATFSNGRSPGNYNMNYKTPQNFAESRPMHSNSNQGFWAPGFGGFSNIPHNTNQQVRQKSPYMMGSNSSGSTNFHHNKSNMKHNSFGSKAFSPKNRKYNSQSVNQTNGHQNIKVNNGLGAINYKTERNCEVPSYSCDTCDRAFASEAYLTHHLSEHVKCNSGDCQFEAHPKIVALHKKMQHDTGYADAISKLKNSDEIEKWRAERRRRFPTLENIEKRKAEQAEKEARGEVIENKEFGKFKGRNTHKNGGQNKDQTNGKKRRRCASRNKNILKGTEHPHSVSKGTLNISESDSDTDNDSHIKLHKFSGMTMFKTHKEGNLESHSHKLSSDSEEMHDKIPQNETSKSMPNGNSVDESPAQHLKEDASSINQSLERDVLQNEVSNSAVYIESDDELLDESPAKKNKFTETQTIKTDSTSQINMSNLMIDVNSNDEFPIELPLKESMSSINQNIKRDYIPQNMYSNTMIDRNSDDESPIELPIQKEEVQKNTISNLIGVDSDDDSPIEIPIRKDASPLNKDIEGDDKLNTISNSGTGVDSDDSPIEIPITKDTSAVNQNVERDVKTGNKYSKAKVWKGSNGNKECPLPPRKSSLLEKLLVDDIRHERNTIMQCIRHIVKENFFGINVNY